MPYFGGFYTVGDACFRALIERIPDLQNGQFIDASQKDLAERGAWVCIDNIWERVLPTGTCICTNVNALRRRQGINKNSVKAGGNKVDYVGKTQKVFDGIVKNLKFLGADGQILTAGKSGKVPPGQISGSGNVAEPFRYFYHPDHLGSTSYVTDASGEVYQHLEYFAFGETFVEEHSNTDKTPYLFNGKELDEETGLYYYGARYYDARTSVWLGIDPMAEKLGGMSPYCFSANNPIRFIDPNGEEFTEAALAYFKKLWNSVTDRMNRNNTKIVGKMATLESGVDRRGNALSTSKTNRLTKQIGRLQNENSQLDEVLEEIVALESSDQMYNVVVSDKLSSSEVDKAGAIYNKATGEVDIVVPKSSKIGLFAHEAHHAYQFETGVTSLTTHDGNLNILPASNWLAYDQTDEIAAYKRQGIFGATHTSLPKEYSNRPRGPVSIRSIATIQNLLRLPASTQRKGFQGIANNTGMAFRINKTTYAPK